MSDCFIKISVRTDTVFSINTDGTYAITILPSNATNNDCEAITKDDSCLMQCYSNGHANKISMNELLQLRRNYSYSHGIFTNTDLQLCDICTNDDFVIVLFEKSAKKYISITPVSALTLHSMLGLKGDRIVKTTFDVIFEWHILPYQQRKEVENIITNCARSGYICLDNQDFSNEILWLNRHVFKSDSILTLPLKEETHQKPEESSDKEGYEFSTLIGAGNEAALKEVFSSYLKAGRNIPVGQGHVRDILSICKSMEDFWLTIKCLLECNVNIYRSPIVVYFKNNPYAIYNPDLNTLDTIIKLIFATDEKIEKNLYFLYPFRTLLTKDMLSFIKSKINGLSRPEYYQIYGSIFNYSSEDLINYCLEHVTPASYYCIYEVLQKISKKEGASRAKKEVGSISSKIDDRRIEGKLIRDLLYYEFKKKNVITTDLVMIKSGGFDEYIKICRSLEGKKKHKDLLNNASLYVGKRVDAKYVATYQNHYYLSLPPGIRVLLPKNVATEKPSATSMTSVYIAMADRNNDTLYATQKTPADYKKITQTPLLNNGDIIEVTFDINGKPEPHKCYKKVKIAIQSYPKKFDSRARYKARVIRQVSDKYHYLVNLIQHI